MGYYNIVVSAVASGLFNNPFVNAYQYLTNEPVPTSEGASQLASEFIANVLNAANGVKDVIHSAMTIYSVVVTAPQVPDVLSVSSPSISGTRIGTVSPNFVAWGFKCDRTRGDIRSGFKRYGLVAESDTSGNTATPAMLLVLEQLATFLGQAQVIETSGGTFAGTPIIVKRVKYVTPAGKDAYRLPEGLDPFEYALATSWSFTGVTTQNSRKG